jgi:8-oxo-dGTP diphosphatase
MPNDPRVGVAIIIVKNNRMLLVQRKSVHGAGTWSTPGGHLEFGESPEQCAAREAFEEVGIAAREIKFRAVTNDIFRDTGKHYITLWMETDQFTSEPRINAPDEVANLDWFDWNALPQPLFLPIQNLLTGKCYPK